MKEVTFHLPVGHIYHRIVEPVRRDKGGLVMRMTPVAMAVREYVLGLA